jgi:hypothetical protein
MTQSVTLTQSTDSVLMVRPCRFYPNPETAADNAFQARVDYAADALSAVARKEFDTAAQTLRAAGVNVHVFEDTAKPEKPDAVFPTTGSPHITMGASPCSRCIQRCGGKSDGTTSLVNYANTIASPT